MLAVIASGCGSSPASSEPAWRAAHPDPTGMTFDEEAPGICAVTAQYPGEAPAAIEYLGETYVQSTKGGVPRTPPGTVVATSDGWTVRSLAGRTLYLLTGDAMYTYRVTSGC